MFHEYPLEKIINQLEKDNLLPAILFRTSRRQCDVDLQSVVKKKYLEIHPQHQQDIEIAVQDVIKKYEYEPMIFKKHSQYEALFKFGVGAHHAGQLLPWRLLLEEIMTKGLLKVLVATGTVAAGVDFPARSVVITAHSKRGNEGFKVLSPSEFQQMSGRAGRRGKDTVGFCFIAPNPYSDARILVDVAKSPPEPLKSAYYASPSTVLNLLKYRSLEELRFTVENSLAGFVDHKDSLVLVDESKLVEQEIIDSTDLTNERKKLLEKKVKRIKRKSEELRLKQITQLEASIQALTNMGYIDEKGSLTTKGKWAAELCTTYVLEFSEAINDFLFDDLSVEELISLVASISGDSHRS